MSKLLMQGIADDVPGTFMTFHELLHLSLRFVVRSDNVIGTGNGFL
jgi:hypothetical protein